MWVLLAAIVVVGLALAVVSAARRELMAKPQSTPNPCCGCTPCSHAHRTANPTH
jgi:hypothetical protein